MADHVKWGPVKTHSGKIKSSKEHVYHLLKKRSTLQGDGVYRNTGGQINTQWQSDPYMSAC